MSSETIGATGLAGRYATALIDLAEADGALDQVAEDLGALDAMIAESEDLDRLIRSPVISRDDQSAAMAALMEKAEMSELTRKFVGLAARNGRLYALRPMIKAYLAVIAARRGEATAEVVSAKELTESQLASLGDALKAAMGTEVSIDTKVDPGVLGGLVVKVGSRMVDSSLATKLQHLRLAMKGVG